jgi:hypothetical protein
MKEPAASSGPACRASRREAPICHLLRGPRAHGAQQSKTAYINDSPMLSWLKRGQ